MITPATETDIPALVNLVYLGKISIPLNQFMWKQWPSEIAQKTRVESAVRGSLNDSNVKSYKVVAAESGHIVGLLVLTRRTPTIAKEQEKESDTRSSEIVAPPELRSDVLNMVAAAINDISRNSADVNHIGPYLLLLVANKTHTE